MNAKITAKKPSNLPTAASAIKLLTDDHKEVHSLFLDYAKLCRADARAQERQPVAEQLCLLLTVHAAIEEEIFYPAAREAGVQTDLLDEADVEHASLKNLIAQIRAMDADDDHYDAKVTVLGEYVDHHVKEEQEEIFPKCREAKMELKRLAERMIGRKTELMAEMSEGMEVAV